MKGITIPNIFFTRHSFDEMLSWSDKRKGTETGGLLLGKVWRDESTRAFVVTHVTGPGPKSRATRHGFRPDIAYYRKMRQKHADLVYLGEWHKHPDGCLSWSKTDLTQVRKIFDQERMAEFLCPICSVVEMSPGVRKMQVQCYYINDSLPSFVPLSYSLAAEWQQSSRRIQYLAVEEKVVSDFLRSGEKTGVVPADIDLPGQVAHVFSRPLQGTHKALLIDASACREIELPYGVQIVITVKPSAHGHPEVCGHFLDEGDRPEARAMKTELVSPSSDIFSRNQALLETSLLRQKHVAIVGAGSIGSVSALELTRAGVGRFTLVDPDTLQVSNLCRHACDLSELGMYKVAAIERRIRRIVPETQVNACAIGTNDAPEKTSELLRDADVLLVTTDTENSRKLVNWIAHRHGIPVIFAGLLERAAGGRVWRVVPGKTACYQCYPGENNQLKGSVAYSEARSLRDLTIQPGLGNDIAFIAHLAVRYVIETLEEPKAEALKNLPNLIFWFNHENAKWKNEPLSLYKVEGIDRNPDCPFCFPGPSEERR